MAYVYLRYGNRHASTTPPAPTSPLTRQPPVGLMESPLPLVERLCLFGHDHE